MPCGRHGARAACCAPRVSGPLHAARPTTVEHFNQHLARTCHAAFNRADRAATDRSGFLVREPTGADKQQSGALTRREPRERAVQFAQLKFRVVVGLNARFGEGRGVDADRHTLEIETASDDSDDDSGPSGVVEVRYDGRTTVQYQGRSYGPENLEEGDVVEIHLRRSRSGRLTAEQIQVIGDARQASPSRSRVIGSAQTPSSRQPRISSSPASTSDQNPRLPVLLGR